MKLKTGEDEYLEEPNKILLEMENFYKTLYTSQLPKDGKIFEKSCKPFLNPENVPKLSAEQQNTCEGLITADAGVSGDTKDVCKKQNPRL